MCAGLTGRLSGHFDAAFACGFSAGGGILPPALQGEEARGVGAGVESARQ